MSVREVNRLTSTWLAQSSDEAPGVVSAAGLWPLLALLAHAADEPGRSELAEAVGLPAGQCADAAGELLRLMDEVPGVDAALGVWAQAAARIDPEWAASLPPGAWGELTGRPATDQPVLDTWASEKTRGLIERFPVEVRADTGLVLATAVALRTTWTAPFADEPLRPRAGAWAGQRLAGLTRTTGELDDLRVADTPAGALTVTRVEGDNGLDVYLALGESGRAAADVLPAAISVLAGDGPVVNGAEILDGHGEAPGVERVRAQRRSLAVTSTRFTVRSDHDLHAHAKLFGLETVSRGPGGHFSRIGAVPMRVDQARQSAVAIFSATGFEAAAVTAVGMRMVSMPVYRERGLRVTYDRPFGFVAVHRATGMALFAGWVGTAERAER
ncbi:hypothetical protein G1H11_10300 [Phytoactinopolyspora alkaliphila]|uniref:Serpin domain-containing protein n=1 Tax=Phytoactinopolyspora alkaliphila TaxID=1783498 RepID=A0A6N9YL81_9ACTN|nr:serpin family protein [Phytoactinopolyspora alkaliphila]NED95702.1 hypothetical protein [Phytoactinopolyspora alkaliphila]